MTSKCSTRPPLLRESLPSALCGSENFCPHHPRSCFFIPLLASISSFAYSTIPMLCSQHQPPALFAASAPGYAHSCIGPPCAGSGLWAQGLCSDSASCALCLLPASYGFYGDVARHSEQLRWMGPMRYDYAGFMTYMRHR